MEQAMQDAAGLADLSPESHGTSAGYAYAQLRDGLIWGRWQPGEKLKPQHLKSEFSTTSGALREALIRLAGEGFVSFEEQRGFSTIKPSRDSFLELRHLRVLLEVEAARLSVEQGGLEWETNLSAAHHRLVYLEEKMRGNDDLRSFIKWWSRYDQQFHEVLISACGSALLRQQYRSIYDKFRLHAVSELRTYGFRGEVTTNEHNDILTAALDRDADACAAAIDRHVTIYRSADRSAVTTD